MYKDSLDLLCGRSHLQRKVALLVVHFVFGRRVRDGFNVDSLSTKESKRGLDHRVEDSVESATSFVHSSDTKRMQDRNELLSMLLLVGMDPVSNVVEQVLSLEAVVGVGKLRVLEADNIVLEEERRDESHGLRSSEPEGELSGDVQSQHNQREQEDDEHDGVEYA